VESGRRVKTVLVGVSNTVLTADQLDTELSYEAMAAVGSGLGSAGFIVVGDQTDAISIAAGISRFLAVESCGQCTPCKQDGLEIAGLLEGMARGAAETDDLITVQAKLATVATGAICSLASQHQLVVGSLLKVFDDQIRSRVEQGVAAVDIHPIAAIVDIGEHGEQLDAAFADKRPDWTYGDSDSGKTPVELLIDHREGSQTGVDG
jgi:NADH:ubiquinone oxidoreductase subunit F (NADH-binding)